MNEDNSMYCCNCEYWDLNTKTCDNPENEGCIEENQCADFHYCELWEAGSVESV